jgi:hypothetical protein
MSIVQKLKGLDLSDDTKVTLTYREGTDVFVHNETELETALAETDVVSTLSSLIATQGLTVKTQYGEDVMESLRGSDYLEGYPRDGTFEDYLTDTINENFSDVDLIDCSVEKYDHKRGYCTLTAQVDVSAQNLIEAHPYLGGWTAKVETDVGTLIFEA